MTTLWKITIRIPRQRENEEHPVWHNYPVEIDPDETVLDAVERVWAFHDRSLTFRHACHHSTCGACGMRVNGVEKLTCITSIRTVTHDHGNLKVEPLRNFPLVSDLVVDVNPFFQELEAIQSPGIVTNEQGKLSYEPISSGHENFERLVDCIECGLCVSACPIALTDKSYAGPAALVGLQQALAARVNGAEADMANDQDGVWRCHSAYECSAVCPSNVEPGYRIMDLRKQLMQRSFRQWFGAGEKK